MTLAVALQYCIYDPLTRAHLKLVRVRRARLDEITALADAGEDALFARVCGVSAEIAKHFTTADRDAIRDAWRALPV